MKKLISLPILLCLVPGLALADQDVTSKRVDTLPQIDGQIDESWKNAPVTVTRDRIAKIDIELRSVHDGNTVYFLVHYPDPTESRRHKYLVWNETLQSYRSGPSREDSFVFKFSMEARPVDLTISGDEPYKADIWYWKANRTDPVGFADDKHHLYGISTLKKSQMVVNRDGNPFYLTRLSDNGRSAYSSQTYEKFVEQEMPRYKNRQPEGSRGDIRTKGRWENGWTIEFARKLVTGHSDDVQFDLNQNYAFGVSRHEIAGKPVNPKLEQPLYESGEIGERLTLIWK